MPERAGVLTEHLRRTTDRDMRVRALIELAERLDVGAKIKTAKSGGTTITIPAKGEK